MFKAFLSHILIVLFVFIYSFVADNADALSAGEAPPHLPAGPDTTDSDGSIYAGEISSHHLYVHAERAEATSWEEATAICANLGERWHVPTRAELAVLEEGKFESTAFSRRGTAWHWSSSLIDLGGQSLAWTQNLADGQGGYASLGNRFAAICVRLEPSPNGPPTNDRL